MPLEAEFHRGVLVPLQRWGRLIRLHTAISGLATLASLAVVLAAGQFAVDYLLSLERPPRAVLLACIAAALARQAWRRVLLPVAAPLTVDRLAVTLESRAPRLGDRLVSAVQFATASGRPPGVPPHHESVAMQRAVLEQAMRDMQQLHVGSLLRHDRLAANAARLAACALVVTGVRFAAPDLVAAYVHRNVFLSDQPWPSDFAVVLKEADGRSLHWPRGDNLALTAAVSGRVPSVLLLEARSTNGREQFRPMTQIGASEFRCEFGPLEQSVSLRFRAFRWGRDDRTDWYEVTAIDRPAVSRARVHVDPPAYTRRPGYDLPAGQVAADVPAGARVTLEIQTNKPVRSARLESGQADLGSAERLADDRWRAVIEPQRSGSWHFALTDDRGLHDAQPLVFSLRLLADRPPTVRLKLPGVGALVLPQAVLPLEFDFEDDFGLRSADFEFQVDRPAAPASQPAAGVLPITGFEPHQTRFTHRRDWPLAPLDLQPSDRLILSARAADFNEAPGARPGRSAVHNLRIVTREELLAELTRREQVNRAEFERILAAQRNVRLRLAEIAAAPASAETRSRYEREERSQRQCTARAAKVLTHFQQILAELELNQLASAPDRRRLGDGIAIPLARLTQLAMPAAAELIDRLARDPGPALAEQADAGQQAILLAMNGILAQMLKWEGYNEAAGLLREILQLQDEVNRHTQQELQRELERLFGPKGDRQ